MSPEPTQRLLPSNGAQEAAVNSPPSIISQVEQITTIPMVFN